jgi:type IV fimbrial biogenesis protein FimT
MLRNDNGYSLYELLMTLTLVGVLVTVSLPSFSATLAKSRQTSEINALFHAIHLARKESIRRRQVMTVCASADGRSCQRSGDWSTGWILFNNTDQDSPPEVDSGESVLLAHAIGETIGVVGNRPAFTLRATFRRATNGTLIFCDRQNRVAPKALIVSYTGRPRVASSRTDGTPYSCSG